MPSLLIAGGRLIDPAAGIDQIADIALTDGIVAAVSPRTGSKSAGLDRSHADVVIEAEGMIVTPGLIDPHVHLREPGGEDAETIATGTASAVAGGFTTVCCMPNTTPAIDDDSMVEFIFKQTERTGLCRVFPVGAASKGRKGEELAEIRLMARAGAVGFSDDGDCVASAGLMSKVLTYIKPTGLAFMQHCQEPTLARGGAGGASMHAGSVASKLGLGGWPRVAEELIIERDVRLNQAIGGGGTPYHVQHLSSGGSVEIVRTARAQGLPVTAEASPHHLLLTHEEVLRHGGYWTNAKMNPPLREQRDIHAMLEGIADGTITILATDHAPHTAERKGTDFESAAFGILGLETALGLYIKALIEPGVIDWPRLIAMMTVEPARLCRLDREGLGRLHVGDPGDVTIIDPNLEWTVDAAEFCSRSRNTPFDGWKLKGRAIATIVAGEVMMDRREEPVAGGGAIR